MKKLTKLLLLALTLALLVGTIFAVGAFAEEKTAVVVPDGYTNTAEHPILVYEASSMTFVKSLASYNALEEYLYNWAGYVSPKYIYLQADLSGNTYYANLGAAYGSHIIDLNNHTITLGSNLVELQAKNANSMSLTFTNGTINVNGKTMIRLYSSANGNGKKSTIIFENITFNYGGGAMVADNNGAYKTENTIQFKNCTVNASSATNPMFQFGQAASLTEANIEFLGGQINYTGTAIPAAYTNASGKATVTFGPYEGQYPVVTAASTVDVSTVKYPTASGELSLGKVSEEAGKITYWIAPADALPKEPEVDPALITPYGTIPEDYKSTEQYPVVVFTSAGAVAYAGELGSLFDSNWRYSSGSVAYLRVDTTLSGSHNNFGHFKGSFTVDLNNKVLKLSRSINNQIKSGVNNGTVNWLFKNGTIDLNGKIFMTISDGGSGSMTGNYNFENVTFEKVGQQWLFTEHQTNTVNWTAKINVLFDNCTFKRTDATYNTCGFYNASTSTGFANYSASVTFKGGVIEAPYNTSVTSFVANKDYTNKTLSFVPGTNGEYLEIQLKKDSKTLDNVAYQTQDGVRYFVPDQTTETATVYRFGKKLNENSDIVVPPSYANAGEHPILVYEASTKIVVKTFTSYYNLLDYLWNYTGFVSSKLIYLQADLASTSSYANVGAMNGSHIFDLNGHTITLGGTMLELQAKNNKDMSLTFKNGTIVVTKYGVVTLSSNANGTGKAPNITFDNIVFDNITGGHLVKDNGNGLSATANKVTFTDCTANVTSGYALFQFGSSANTSIDAKFLGGKIVYAGNVLSAPYVNTNDLNNQTLVYGENDKGEYPTVSVSADVDVRDFTFPSQSGTRYLRKTAEENGVVTYALNNYGFISTYLNLTNDLNMVYRVFLPDGIENPTVTFEIDGFEKTVEAFGRDENGLYLFKLAGVTPAKMNESISARLTAQTVNASMENTIKAYLDSLLEKYKDDEELTSLVESLLVYGAAAQQYVGQSADSFVTEIGELSAVPEFAVTKNGTASVDYSIVGAGLRLDGAFDFGVQIKAASIQGLTLVITTANETAEIALSSANKVGDYYVVYFNELTALELSDNITFALWKNGEQIGKSLTMSANAYLYNASLGNDANLATLAKALYAYGVAAKAYQG